VVNLTGKCDGKNMNEDHHDEDHHQHRFPDFERPKAD
jgi:hypothetical protein